MVLIFHRDEPLPDQSVEDQAQMVVAHTPVPGPRVLQAQDRKFLFACIMVILKIFKLYEFDSAGFSTKPTLDHWCLLATYCSPLKLMKYKLAAFYSAWKNQEIPKAPFPSEMDNPKVLIGGRAMKFVENRHRNAELQGVPEYFDSILVSVLYSKKGMPRPTRRDLRDAEIEAFHTLTTLPPSQPVQLLVKEIWGDLKEDDKRFSFSPSTSVLDIASELKRTVRELFSGIKYTDEERYKPFFPSTSANYIRSRNQGGSVELIMNHAELLKGLTCQPGDLVKLDLHNGSDGRPRVVVDDSRLNASFKILYERILATAMTEIPYAEPLALPEALKTRVITKGPGFTAAALKPLQKFLWSTLVKHPVFSLIGEPVSPEYIQSRLGSQLREGFNFTSVDYSDATNQLFSWVSELVGNCIAETVQLSSDEHQLFIRALVGHKIVMSESDLDDLALELTPRDQKRGQLMGSVVSFPVLCIVNAAICRWALEVVHQKKILLRDAPLCINGDDAVIKGPEQFYDVWAKIATSIGLAPSVGKVYRSREFLNMNSTTYNYLRDGAYAIEVYRDGVPVHRVIHYELVPYVNMGLLLGLKRSGGKQQQKDLGSTDSSIGARARELIRLCPPYIAEQVLRQYINENHNLLVSLRIPWFLPESFGGVGLPIVGAFKPANRELRLARVILNTGVKVPRKPLDVDWNTWQLVSRRFEEFRQVALESQLVTLYEHSGTLFTQKPIQAVWRSSFPSSTTSVDDLELPQVDLDDPWPEITYGSPVSDLSKKRNISAQTFLGLCCVETLFSRSYDELYGNDKDLHKQEMAFTNAIRDFWRKLYRTKVYPEPLNLQHLPPTLDLDHIPLMTTYTSELQNEIFTQLGNEDIADLVLLYTLYDPAVAGLETVFFEATSPPVFTYISSEDSVMGLTNPASSQVHT